MYWSSISIFFTDMGPWKMIMPETVQPLKGRTHHLFPSTTIIMINTPGRWFHSSLGIPTPQESYSMWPPSLALHVWWRKALSIQPSWWVCVANDGIPTTENHIVFHVIWYTIYINLLLFAKVLRGAIIAMTALRFAGIISPKHHLCKQTQVMYHETCSER